MQTTAVSSRGQISGWGLELVFTFRKKTRGDFSPRAKLVTGAAVEHLQPVIYVVRA
jgi:hypothetical protein